MSRIAVMMDGARIIGARAHELVPGDLVYDTWETGAFELTDRVPHPGFDLLTYTRAPALADGSERARSCENGVGEGPCR